MIKVKTRRIDTLNSDGVERGEGNTPSAFRIWRAGKNITDHGPTVFSDRSASLLLEEQQTRGNRYSMDINHLSLNPDAPLANQRAVGFFELDVRDGELWAVNCEWSQSVKAGLTTDPPEWKYFSPAYDVDPETDEVVSFLNCALTNNPATHRVTALASRVPKKKNMKKTIKAGMAYEDVMADLMSDDPDKKKTAEDTIKAALSNNDKELSDDGEPVTPKSLEDEEAMPEDDEPEVKSAKATRSLVASQDSELSAALARIAVLEAKSESDEKTRLIASREMTKSLASKLAGQPLSYVRDVCGELPLKSRKDAMTAAISASPTRGDAQLGNRESRLPAAEKAAMDARMGLSVRTPTVRRDGTRQIFETLTPDDARRLILANRAKKEASK